MGLNNLFESFNKPPKDVYILVREGSLGMETYANPLLKQFNPAAKAQLTAFLKGLLAIIEGPTDARRKK